MTTRIFKFTVLVLAFSLGPFAANAELVEFEGHQYEVIVANDINWAIAKTNAEGMQFAGVSGHLATITSSAENAFLNGIRQPILGDYPGKSEAWIGGSQPSGSGDHVGWTWVNGEGPITGGPGPSASPYANWHPAEPNNAGTEDQITLGRYLDGFWNDSKVGHGNIGGYIVEYDTQVVVDAGLCATPAGCELPGTTLVFPPTTDVPPGAKITAQSFEFYDDPARCGVSSLVLFGDPDPKPDVHIPAWLCGSPRIVILDLDTGDVEFPDGVFLVKNDSPLPGNDYSCDSPNIPVGSDLRHQDVLGWQATNFEDMVEHRYHADDPDPEFADLAVSVSMVDVGHMGEYSDGCSSTEGRVRGGSYVGIGLHIHPNGTVLDSAMPPDDPSPDNTLLEFHRIIRYKLALLQFSILESEPPVLGRNDFTYMEKQVGQAIKQMNKGEFESALDHVANIEERAEIAVYTGGLGTENGEHLSRTANLIFMLDQKSSLP